MKSSVNISSRCVGIYGGGVVKVVSEGINKMNARDDEAISTILPIITKGYLLTRIFAEDKIDEECEELELESKSALSELPLPVPRVS